MSMRDFTRWRRFRAKRSATALGFETLESRVVLSGTPLITEFMASNNSTLADGDGNSSDWIEIHNPSNAVVDLAGWHLTDDAANLDKWTFPDLPQSVLDPGEYLVVFASGQATETYVDPGGNLHTDFKLGASGEYLGLTDATEAIVHEYAPSFPQQLSDVSYGIAINGTTEELVASGAEAEIFLPTDDSLGLSWTTNTFVPDGSWITESSPGVPATTGVGFDSSEAVPNLVAHWPLNEPFGTSGAGSVEDASGAGHSGAPTGSLTFDVAGANAFTGTGVDFEDAVIDVPYDADLNPDSFTFATWVKPESTSGFQSVVTSRFDDNPNHGYVLYNSSSGNWQFWTGTGFGGGWDILSGPPVITDVWQHLAISFDDATNTKSLWVNGQEVASTTGQDYGPNPTTDLHIGAGGDLGNEFFFDGVIDDAALYDVALDASSIQSIMDNGVPDSSAVAFAAEVNTDIAAEMEGTHSSAFIRVPFNVDDPALFDTLLLRMKYDDGFVAYLNGQKIAERNAPTDPSWDDVATSPHPDSQAVEFEEIDVSAHLSLLETGDNVLAIHGLSTGTEDVNFLIVPELIGSETSGISGDVGFFLAPTPGQQNPDSVGSIGPEIGAVQHGPDIPTVADPVVVTAAVSESFHAIDFVTLHYRVMYGGESTLAMADDGSGDDQTAGDGIFTATIPAGVAAAGEMLRYFITADDVEGNTRRAPVVADTSGNSQDPEYFGTVVFDPDIDTDLPVWQWFTENETNSHNRTGARASVFYNGVFYDNLYVRQRGQATNSSKSQKFDFNNDQGLFVDEELGFVTEINMNGNGSDASYLRQSLSFDTFAATGGIGSKSFLTYMTVNGSFDRVGIFIEQVDLDLIDRHGIDDGGELYKFVQRNNLDPVFTDGVTDGVHGPNSGIDTGIERKTGDPNDLSSVEALIDGLHLPTVGQRQSYLMDHFDTANLVNYFAVRALIQDADDIRKNFYMYLDSGDTAEWHLLPWDKDFTYGVEGDGGPNLPHPFFGEFEHLKFNANQWNVLADVLFEAPVLQQMYLRRLRTLMDEFLLPPGTAAGASWMEQQTEAIFQPAEPHLSGSAIGAKNGVLNYVDDRREDLYTTYGPGGSEPLLPDGQVASPSLTIGAIDFNPASGIQDQEYIEIQNPSGDAVDISGWTVERAITHTFQAGTVVPANGELYITPSSAAFRARTTGPSGGQGLLVQQWGDGNLSSFGETITIKRADGSIAATETYQGDPSQTQQFLRITELHYHPAPPTAAEISAGFTDSGQFEFIELVNNSSSTLDLQGVHFAPNNGGVTFAFESGESLAPSERGVLVSDLAAFQQRYGLSVNILGTFAGSLSNGGEQIDLEDATNSTILRFNYEDGQDPGEEAWPVEPDGGGPSLVVVDTEGDYNDGANWVASSTTGGTPGSDEAPAIPGDYDQDGTVATSDYTLWNSTFGSTTDLRADGNENNIIDSGDYAVWREHLGQSAPLAVALASSPVTASMASASTQPAPQIEVIAEDNPNAFAFADWHGNSRRAEAPGREAEVLRSAASGVSGAQLVAAQLVETAAFAVSSTAEYGPLAAPDGLLRGSDTDDQQQQALEWALQEFAEQDDPELCDLGGNCLAIRSQYN